jgi:FMN phosphatase YigB (HAD superfamily)
MDCRKMCPKAFIFLLLVFSRLSSDVVVWDVGGVLCGYDEKKLFAPYSPFDRLKGYFSALNIIASFEIQHPFGGFRQHLKNSYFQTLARLPYKSSASYEVYSDDGITPMPALLKDLMLGHITYEKAKKIWCTSEHPDIFDKTFEFNFNPTRFADALTLLPAVDLLQQCAKQFNEDDGSKKNVCIILSNMDAAVVPLLKAKFATEIAQYVDHWIFSGEVHCAKPDKSIYEVCLKCINKLPADIKEKIYFIDDQKVNRDAAKPCIPGIVCMHPDEAFEVLRDNGVLISA